MKSIDFLILYEHRERELENACLIKIKLQREGYSVEVRPIYSFNQNLIDAKVIILPHLYDEKQASEFISKYRTRECKVINMQYEQVLSADPKNSDYSIPKGIAQKGVIFAWGNKEFSRYINTDQPVKRVGNISMDFNRNVFDKYFLSSEEIRNEFHLKSKNTMLFISSFSMVNYSRDKIKNNYKDNYEEMCLFTDISKNSRKIILKWMEQYLIENNDVDIIYRPHPAEEVDAELLLLQNKYDNFYIIRKYSIRQWIRVSNILLNWFSTSSVDAFYAGKKCILLRPIKIPHSLDVPFLEKCEAATSYLEMIKSIKEKRNSEINSGMISDYYGEKISDLAIEKFSEECKNIINNDKYAYKWEHKKRKSLQVIRSFIRDILYDLNAKIRLDILYKIIFIKNNNLYKKSLYIQREVFSYKLQIDEYCKRLENIGF